MSTPTPEPTPERILHRLDWHVIRRLDGLMQGDYRSLLYGYGLDFADLREYQPEDDVRYIDWNVTARMDLVTTLARLLTRHGNRVGAILYGGRVERMIPARGGRIQVLRLANDLLKQPRLPRAPFTDLTPLLVAGLHSIKRRSLIFIISDFISAPGWERPLSLLNQRHEVLAIRLWDPREIELPDVGPIIMEDAETGEQLYVDTHDKKFRQRFLAAAQQREAGLNESFNRSGVAALSLSTEEDLVRAIVRFAALRKQRRR